MTGPEPQPRKPIILTVDDDPAVSRAVARDLRRHYGENYRIVRAESGPDALETLTELKLRGDTVAVFVADYRMPQMSGIEFLEQAMDIYPTARRVLLTAYADTHAAIDAINVVDLDHYLLKPWDPPEEKLYPVIDGLLEAWRAAGDRPIPHTKIIGHRWNARSSEVRDFLTRNRLSYHWFMADEPEGKRLLEAAGQDGRTLPVVITAQGEPLINPSETELADRLGLSTTPSEEFYDLVVIGGGPAGLAAAVYGASEGLRTVLIERTATGGQAGQSSRIENYLGFPDGVSGSQLAERARRAGREVQGRADHHPRSCGARDQRAGQDDQVRRRHLHRLAGGDPRDRGVLPAAARPTAVRTSPAAASTTARRPRSPRSATTRRCTSSAAPTRPVRRRCTSRVRRSR